MTEQDIFEHGALSRRTADAVVWFFFFFFLPSNGPIQDLQTSLFLLSRFSFFSLTFFYSKLDSFLFETHTQQSVSGNLTQHLTGQ